MAYKKTFKERFESTVLFTALAAPVAGFLGGAWLGATSSIMNGVGGAILFGAGGAMTGLVLGGFAGAVGFTAANAIYKNKEYIALAVVAVASLPFALAARGLDGMRRALSAQVQKIRPVRSGAAADGTASVPEKPAAAKNTPRSIGGWLKSRFQNKSGRTAETKTPASKAPKNNAPAIKPDNAPGV